MNIQYGIRCGALLQRNGDDLCETILSGQWQGTLSANPGKIRILSEDTALLTGIPVGGPYTITISDDVESVTYTHVYVGDLWLLAGQSNMEGAGRLRKRDREEPENPAVRALYMDDRWDSARVLLHQLWLSGDPAHVRTCEQNGIARKTSGVAVLDDPPMEQKRGVGPGYFFARAMYRKTGVPQGVIPAAVGGAPIEMWTPPTDGGDNYYTAAYRRIRLCGCRIRGLFWYQGEGYNSDLDEYDHRFTAMRDGFQTLCAMETLPTVQAQVFRCFLPGYKSTGAVWSRYRGHQWEMAHILPALATVATNDLDLDDLIHLSADAQEILGSRACDAMCHLLYGTGNAEPEIAQITAEADDCVPSWTILQIRYRNLRGKLCAAGVPNGFTIGNADVAPDREGIQRIGLDGDTVWLRCEWNRDTMRQKTLWYGYGHDTYCNITDEGGHAIPATDAIRLCDWLAEQDNR